MVELPNITSNYMPGLINYANSITEGGFGLAIMIIVGIGSLLLTIKSFSPDRAIAFSAFLTFLVSIFLRFLNFISDGFLYASVAFLALALIFLMFSRNKESGA